MKYSVLMSIYEKVKPDELVVSIQSMLDQTYPPDEIVVVLDGKIGTELEKVLAEFDVSNKNIFTFVRLEENHGLAYALNEGLAVARNELIARMDSDDYSLPRRCELQVKTFMKDGELALLGTNIGFFEGDPQNVISMKRSYPTDLLSIKKSLRRNDPFSHPTVMYKKSKVLECGGYDPALRRRQDYDLFSLMVVTKGYKAENLEDTLLLFRADSGYKERNRNKESCKNRIAVQKKIYKRKGCSLLDYIYIWSVMNIVRIIPQGLYNILLYGLKR